MLPVDRLLAIAAGTNRSMLQLISGHVIPAVVTGQAVSVRKMENGDVPVLNLFENRTATTLDAGRLHW